MPDSYPGWRLLVVRDELETEALGRRLAEVLQPGDVIALVGDLGAGKTRLTQAIAMGLGVDPAEVSSPTFTLIQEYRGRLTVRHCDAYRLRRPEEFADLGLDELFGEDGVAIIEWADRVTADLPLQRLEIRMTAIEMTSRQVDLIGHGTRGFQIVDAVRDI